jgi:hypothetical protein
MKDAKVAAGVELCRECLGLRGPCLDTFSHCERTQRCSCEPKEPLWKAYDYNTAIELCRCCGAATVRSGSRWSPFFCDACKERVLAYNRVAGSAVIPIGRHSIMNGISLSGEDAKSVVAQAAFEAGMANLFARVDRLWMWHRDRVRVVVQSIPGEETAIPLERYLEHVRARGGSPDVAFDALVLAVTAPLPPGN